MRHSPVRPAPSAPPATRGYRGRGRVRGARHRVGSRRPCLGAPGNWGRSPAPRGARGSAPDPALRAAAPRLGEYERVRAPGALATVPSST